MTDSAQQRAEKTYKLDLVRGGLQGVIEMVASTFALLIAIRIFQAPESLKPLLPAAISTGLLLSPFGLYLGGRFKWHTSRAVGVSMLVSAACFATAATSAHRWQYILAVVIALLISAQATPLMTQIYSSNYDVRTRGRRFSSALLLTALTSVLLAWFGGRLLDIDLSHWRMILGAAAVASFLSAIVVSAMPSDVMGEFHLNPFRQFPLVIQDKLFGQLLLGWMFMGLGNLMTLPLRIEYIANPEYGIQASNAQVALLTISIPQLFRLLSIKPWGWIFDRTNLVGMRILLNCLFLASLSLYFWSDQLWLIGIGAVFLGLAMGGAGIIWPLWVTKVAPLEKVPAYMSIHSSLTGLRGVAAPFIGYSLIATLAPNLTALVGITLIVISTLIFLPVRKNFAS